MFRIAAVGLFVLFYMSSMKMCFGTYFLRTAVSNYKSNKVIRKRYYELFASRDNLLYHIAWSKTRGELEEAKNLMLQLEKVDKVKTSYLHQTQQCILAVDCCFITTYHEYNRNST